MRCEVCGKSVSSKATVLEISCCFNCLEKAAKNLKSLHGPIDPDLVLEIIQTDSAFQEGMYEELIHMRVSNRSKNNLTIVQKNPRASKSISDKKTIRPKDIVTELDKTIIGQDELKRALALTAFKHQAFLKSQSNTIKKTNLLIVGKTGTGKSEAVKQLAKILDVPFVRADSTSFSPAGYKGTPLTEIISRLMGAANNNKDKAQEGIVLLDEIDKIGLGHKSDLSGRVQQELLAFIEGGIYTPDEGNGRRTEFSTDKVLFICCGAFEGINNKERTISLNINKLSSEPEKIKPLDIVKYGIIPELAGRLSYVVQTNELTCDDLKGILLNSNQSPLLGIKEIGLILNKEIMFSDNWIDSVATRVLKVGLGARPLVSVIDDDLTELIFNLNEIQSDKIYVDIDHNMETYWFLDEQKFAKAA